MTCAWRNAIISASHSADPDLIAGWVAARSIARGLPTPVADHGGWRIDTRSEAEWCRYVFAKPAQAIADLVRTIERPRIFLKLCATGEELAALLSPQWHIVGDTWVMTSISPPASVAVPPDYATTVKAFDGAIGVRITASDGSLAASGYAAEAAGVFVYDRIVTDAAHQRRGLGSAVMALLGSQRQSASSRQMLVATAQGRALYTTLGWQVHAPYSTAVIPDRPA